METNQWDEMVQRILASSGTGTAPGSASLSAAGAQLVRLAASTTSSATTTSAGSVLPAARSLLQGTQALLPGVVQSVLPAVTGKSGGGFLSTLATGLGVGPLITGLIRLFGGGGGQSEPPPLVKFQLPAAVSREESLRGSADGGSLVSYGQNGLPRSAGGSTSGSPQQITIQVQAIDSKSFLDHSESIARAVREAMLYSHSLNDVVTEL